MDITQARSLKERVLEEHGTHPSLASIGISPDGRIHVHLYMIDPELEMSILAITGPRVEFHTVQASVRAGASTGG